MRGEEGRWLLPRVYLRIILLAVTVIPGEALLRVRDVDAAVDRALERAEDAVARRRAHEADVEHRGERPRAVLVLDEELLAVGLIRPLVLLVQPELLQQAARSEQAGGVARSIVGEADLDAILRELVRVR